MVKSANRLQSESNRAFSSEPPEQDAVSVLQRPFDIESAKSLKGSDIADQDHQPRSFALQLSRKIGS